MSSSKATAKSNNAHQATRPSTPISPFVPFHLFETSSILTSASSTSHARRTDDVTKQYFRTLREIMGLPSSGATGNNKKPPLDQRKFQWLIVSNFLIDFTYFLEQTSPEILEFHRVVVFYGESADGDQGMDAWRESLASCCGNDGNDVRTVEFIRLLPSDPPRSSFNPLPIKSPYGL